MTLLIIDTETVRGIAILFGLTACVCWSVCCLLEAARRALGRLRKKGDAR
jgi:hypothetical protein